MWQAQATRRAQLGSDPAGCATDQHGFPRGSVIYFGKYELLSRINIGGMAEIVKARDTSLPHEQLVAIKRILPHLCDDQQYRAMFMDESRVLAQLQHPSVIEAFEIGEIDDTPYIALEYIHGQDARALFHEARRAEQRIPIAIACYVIARVCEGLHHAHEQTDANGQLLGIVHRDVSLQNILLSYNGDVKLTDFGIAVSAENVARTDLGVVKGKYGYMSPEQIKSGPLDRRSDVFAVGICLYELLTSERLFSGENDYKAVERVRNVEFEPPSALNRQIPSRLERIVMKALAKHPRDRYPSTNDLRRALQAFMAEANEFVSSDDLGAYMRDTFTNELASEAAFALPPSDRVTAAKPIAEVTTGLHAFDGLAPVGAIDVAPTPVPPPEEITVVGPQAHLESYDADAFDLQTRGALRHGVRSTGRPTPSVPPIVPRANSIPASAAGRMSAASLLDVGPPVQPFNMDWDEHEPTTISQGYQDAPQAALRGIEDSRPPHTDESARVSTTRRNTPLAAAADADGDAGGYGRSMTTLEIPTSSSLNPLWIAGALGVVALGLLLYQLRDRGVATLRLETDPRDAVVSVDGQRAVGVVSPFVISELAAGVNHTIAVEKPGYVGWSTRLRVRPDKTFELPLVKLERVPSAPAQEPSRAPSSVEAPNAVPAPKPSNTDVEHADNREASHVRRDTAPARRPEHAQVRRPHAADSSPSPAPAAAPASKAGMGTLRINTRPWSQVKVDGRAVGNTPQMNLQLSAGSHTVTLTNPDFGINKSVVIDIKPDSTVTRVLTLVP